MSAFKELVRKHLSFIVPAGRRILNFVRYQRSKVRVKRLLRQRKEILLELGSGNKKGSGKWVTLDMTENCDVFWDVTNGLPFSDNSVAKIYSSHFFEHFTYEEAQKLLDECLRILVPGGTFSICVPNARIYLEAYLKGETLDPKMFGWKPAYNNTTKMDYVNYIAYMDTYHKYMFDKENLVHILKSKGFARASLREFDSQLDRQARDFESIYAEGFKP